MSTSAERLLFLLPFPVDHSISYMNSVCRCIFSKTIDLHLSISGLFFCPPAKCMLIFHFVAVCFSSLIRIVGYNRQVAYTGFEFAGRTFVAHFVALADLLASFPGVLVRAFAEPGLNAVKDA